MSFAARIAATARQDIRVARRNRWTFLATMLMTVFALALALFAAGQSGEAKADTLTLTAASVATLSVYLVPLIALLVSYDAIAGEVERGTLALVLATPLGRAELFAGKFIAGTIIVGSAVMISFLVAAGVTFAFGEVSGAGLLAWVRLGLTSLALGAVFVALGLAVSAASARAASAAAVAVGLWLVFVVLWDVALLGTIMATGEGMFASHVFPWLVLGNPADAFRIYNLVALDSAPVAGLDGLARTLPVPPAALLLSLAIWAAAALAAAAAFTRRLVP